MTIAKEDTATRITPEITPQGVVIPREAVQEWLDQGIEIIKNRGRTVIQPQALSAGQEKSLAIQALREDGLLVNIEKTTQSPPSSPEERAVLARKLAAGRPLSEIVIEERREKKEGIKR